MGGVGGTGEAAVGLGVVGAGQTQHGPPWGCQGGELEAGGAEAESQGEGVERIFPIHSPRIAKIVVKKAGLVDTLKGAGPFTVFAPTDAAFAKLGDISGLFDRVGGEPRKGIAAVSAGDGAVVAGFAPHLQADSTTSVQALPHNLFVTDGPFDTSLRTLDTGARDPLAAGGLGPLVNATVATGSGLGVAATITTKVNAQDSGRLSFYTTTSR